MKILVTGSSGQIGSYVVDEARAKGHQVVGLDLRPSKKWTTVVGDICSPPKCIEAMTGVEAVIHCAAQVSVQGSIQDPTEDAKSNTIGTLTLLEAARKLDVKTFVNVSSAAVYGRPQYLPVDEEHPTAPLSPYGASKLSAEHYTRLYQELHGLNVVTVRPFNVYSPRQNPNNPYSGVMSKFAARVHMKKAPVVYGDGSQSRDFVHARDVSTCLLELSQPALSAPLVVLNFGSGIETTIKELANLFQKTAPNSDKIVHAPAQQGEIPRSVSGTNKARSLGITPRVSLEEGIKELVSEAGHRTATMDAN